MRSGRNWVSMSMAEAAMSAHAKTSAAASAAPQPKRHARKADTSPVRSSTRG